jgi:AcrR family transcriptional regulator
VTSSVSSVNLGDRAARREARLLDAAARLFAHFGFDKTSIDEIARQAGVSKGAVYLHWPSKDALFEAILIREGLRIQDVIRERIDNDPAGGTLAAIYRHSILAVQSSPLMVAVLTFDARVLGDYMRRQDPSINARRFVYAEEFVNRMQAAGLMRAELDPGVTAYVMGVLSFGLVGIRQLAPQIPGPSLERLADALADLVDRGLATHTNEDSNAGKQAYRTLVEETTSLYIDQSEAASGSHHRPRSPG